MQKKTQTTSLILIDLFTLPHIDFLEELQIELNFRALNQPPNSYVFSTSAIVRKLLEIQKLDIWIAIEILG